MPDVMIDWEGLSRSLQTKQPVPGDPSSYLMNTYTNYDTDNTKYSKDGLQYDVAGLWNAFEFNNDKWNKYWNEMSMPVRVERNDKGFNLFSFLTNDVPDFAANALVDVVQFQINPLKALQKSYYKKIMQDPKLATEYAKQLKDKLPQLFAQKDPGVLEEIGAGVEEGIIQNIGLLIGGDATSYDKARMEAINAAMIEGRRASLITKEDFETYQGWVKERQMNTGLAFDIAAGLTNSVLIMGELAATGGIAAVDMAGVKFFTTQGLKLWGKGILKQGVNTWKLMGAGANIRAMGDAIDTARDENLSFGEFVVELTGNAVKENLSAFAEGASEGVLLNMRLGSVPLKKWLGQPVKMGEKEITKYMTAKELKSLMKSAYTPEIKAATQTALNTLRQNRKDIVKAIEKNVGKKMLNGLLLETSTEQLTDLLQDAFEKESHASALNLFSGDPEHRDQAFRNLVVEASVGLALGFGMGLGEIWSRKPMQELRDKYGDEVANTVEKVVQDPQVRDKVATVMIDNGKPTTDADVKTTPGTAQVMQDLGSQEEPETPLSEEEQKARQQARMNLPTDIAMTMAELDQIDAPNILDFTMLLGQKQLTQTDKNLVAQVSELNLASAPSNFLLTTSPKVMHTMTQAAYNNVLNLAIENGMLEKIAWVPESNVELKRDLAVGVALKFDDIGWGYVRNKYSNISNIDFTIDEAKKLAKSNHRFNGKTRKKLQESARKRFVQGIVDNKREALNAQSAVVIEGEVGYTDFLDEKFNEETERKVFTNVKIEGGGVSYTGDIDDLGSALDNPNERWETIDRTPYMSVAIRDENGKVYYKEALYHTQHGDIVYGPRAMEGALRATIKGQYGYVDWEGNFFTRDEVNARWGYKDDYGFPVYVGESVMLQQMGLLPKRTRWEGIPDATFKMPTYDTVLPDVSETTFLELAKWFEQKGIINETTKEVLDKILPVIGNRKIIFADMGKDYAGGTDVYTLETHINTKAPMIKSTSPFDTMLHEGLHSWLMLFMDSNSDLANKFKGQVRGVLNTVRSVMNASPDSALLKDRWLGTPQELKEFVTRNSNILRKATKNEEEFLSSVFSDTQSIKWLTDRVYVGGPTRKLTGWKKIWNSIAGVLKKEATVPATATQKLKESVEDFSKIITGVNRGLNAGFNIALVRENRRATSQVSSGYQEWETWDDDLEDELDDYQTLDDIANDDENKIENQTVNNFISMMADAMNISEIDYRESIRQKPFEVFKDDMQKFDKENNQIITKKLERIYNGYKHIWPTFPEFRSQFLKRQYLNVVNKTAKLSAIMVASNEWDPNMGQSTKTYQIRLVKGSYIDGNGVRRNTYKETIALEGFIPKLEEILRLDPETLHPVFIDGFESWRDGKMARRSSFSRLRKEFFFDYSEMNQGKNIPITSHLSQWLWSNSANTGAGFDMLYLGNFAKKNTLPVLAFRSEDKAKIRAALERFETVFANTAAEHYGATFQGEQAEANRMAQTARALLESMWFNKQFVQNEFGQYTIADPSIVKEDWNKVMKRATKWLVKQTKIALTETEIKKKFSNRNLSGIKIVGNDAEIRTAVINSYDNRVITFKIMGHTFSMPASDLLLNDLGTPIGDGASVYIIGQFDELYSVANGALKSGIIKNVYASKEGEQHTFIKHAMHGVHKDSLLGKWMIENNIGILVFDESMKEGKDHYTPIGLAELSNQAAMADATNVAQEKGQETIFKLKLSGFQRIKEIENRDTLGGSTKQILNGTAFSDLFNKALQEAVKKAGIKTSLNDLLTSFSNAQTQQAVKWFQRNSTPQAYLNLVREIVANPRSPLEKSVSNIWGTLLEPKEGQTDEDILNKYAGAFDHAHTAEAIRNRMQHRMSQLLGGKTAGMRSGLSFNGGYLNHKRDVEPIATDYNLADILINEFEAAPREVLEAAVPESGALTIIRKLQDAGRAESRAHSDLSGQELHRRVESLKKYRTKLIAQLRALESSRINNIISEGSNKVSIHRLIDWQNPIVQQWKNEVIFGKVKEDNGVEVRDESGILNIATGRLREGWQIVPEDFASQFGVKPGDWVVDIITPADSPMSIAAFRVAAISKVTEDGTGRKVSDRNAAVVNSEWSQTKGGKDHDADDISKIPFHPDYWRLDEFKDFVKVAREIPAVYTKHIKNEVIKILNKNNDVIKTEKGAVIGPEELNDPEQTDRLIFGEPMVKEKISILLNGAPQGRSNRRVFPMMGDSFIELDSLYLFSPAPIINERLYHTATSSINMRAKKVPLIFQDENGKMTSKGRINDEEIDAKADFEVRHPNWMRTNVNHQNRTHADVDFPNKTTRLAYDNDPFVLAEQFWGLTDDPIVSNISRAEMRPMYQAIRNFQKLLFEDAFNLARRRDTDLYESLGYFETIAQLSRAKARLNTLALKDKEGLKRIHNDFIGRQKVDVGNKFREGSPEHNRAIARLDQEQLFISGFIDNMEIDNVWQYPLFNTIRNLNINDIPQPGNTYKDHLINQVLATGETITMWPEVHKAYLNALQAPKSFFIVGYSASERVAKQVLNYMGRTAPSSARSVLKGLLRDPEKLAKWKRAARPGNVKQIDKLIDEFVTLESRVKKPYEPFVRGAQNIYVDNEVIAFSRIPRQMDFAAGRAVRNRIKVEKVNGEIIRRPYKEDEYWDEQLRMIREEAVTIMLGMDVEPQAEWAVGEDGNPIVGKLTDTAIERRTAHQRVYPRIWKQILSNEYLYFNSNEAIELKTPDKNTLRLKNDGRGGLNIIYNGITYKHTQLTPDHEVYKLFTERNGLWEGIEEESIGTANRAEIRKILRIQRNLSIEARFNLLKDFIGEKLYGTQSTFTTTDQVAFWTSMLAQTSNQALQDNKAKGFIVNQSAWDPTRPYKYQNNHLALDLMAMFEEPMMDGWLQLYAHANQMKERMVYEDQDHMNPQQAIRTFYSGLRDQVEEVSKDSDFVSFYKSMRGKDWKEGLGSLRKLIKNVVLLKALSENGVYYEDLARDIATMSDTEFFNKYKGVDTEQINLTIERYMGKETVESFLRQQAGEDTVAFRTRGTIIALYWSLNGVRKKEQRKEAKLGKISRFFASFIGIDLTSLLGEKKTYALAPKDKEIAFFFDPEEGTAPVTTNDVQIAIKSLPTRTWLALGESTVAMTKTQRANRTLNQYNIDLNDQVRLVDDITKLLSDPEYRGKWREQFSHRRKWGRKVAPEQYTDRTRLISRLLEQIPEGDRKQLELARKEMFELAENLRKRGKIYIEVVNGQPTYNIELNKIYRYKNLEDLINNHLGKATPQKKLALIGALDLRMMYDVIVPNYLDKVVAYLQETRDNLNSATSFTTALNVEATIRKYEDIRESLAQRSGDYMPHMFPESEFRILWLKGFMNHEVERIINEIADAKRSGKNPTLAELDPTKDLQTIHDMAYSRAETEYSKLSHEWSRGSIIPNFLPRQFPNAEGYTKTDPTIHLNYITKLIEGFKKDVLKADFYLYQQKAREAGERTAIMELTREWYARQINDEELSSKPIKADEIKPGMQINFNQRSFLIRNNDSSLTAGVGVVSGIVRKVTANEVILDLDTDRIKYDIKRDLEKARNIADKLKTAANHKASRRQVIVLQNLLLKGFLTNTDFKDIDLSEMSMEKAADLTVIGLKRAYNNVESMTHFKFTDIWTSDARGERLDGQVRRYARSGAIEHVNTKERELHNLQIMAGRYDGVVPETQYRLWKAASVGLDWWRKGMKRATSLLYMGMASAFKARVVNQFGATISNLVDAPLYNSKRWKRGMEIWDRIKHGRIELMDPDDAKLYKTLVSLGLTEDNSVLAIALEAANIKPEDMLVHDAKPQAIKWLVQLWQDAAGYKETQAKVQELRKEQLKTADPNRQNALQAEILAEQKLWQAKVEGILSTKNPTEEEKKAAMKKVEELWAAGKQAKLNIAEEQGVDLNMATRLVGSVLWKSFYTSNLGVGFQAKAEKLRIPAFFIGYTTAIDMGFTEDEAIQFGINSIEMRHAFYGTANKQFGANTQMGTVLFQYAQYQYNSLSKAIRIMHEAIPQMLRFAHNRPEEVSRINHLGNMFKLVQTSVDAKGNALKRGEVTLKEINLLHSIGMKVLWTGIMMQLGTRIFYGITNFQDPVGQAIYKTLDYIITLIQSGFDPGDDDDRERMIWAIQDASMVTGLLYKYQLQALQAMTDIDEKGFGKSMADTFYRGRAEDTANFLWRATNTMHQVAWELGVVDTKLSKKERTYFDMPWLFDDFATGIKIVGWSPADNRPGSYQKRGFFGTRTMDAYTAGRYVETHGKGISGFGESGSRTRFTYLFDPQSYVPFLDRMITGK